MNQLHPVNQLHPAGQAGQVTGPPGNFPDDDPHAGLEQIVEQLRADAAVQQVSELRLELPYEFDQDDYEQILHDVADAVAPELGWQPSRTQVV